MGIRVNGEVVAIVDSAAIRADTADAFEVFGETSAEFAVRDTGETDPAGRYRWRTEDDEYKLQRSLTAAYAKPVDLIKAVSQDADGGQGSHGIGLVAFNEDGLEDLMKLLILQVETGGPIGLYVRQLIQSVQLS